MEITKSDAEALSLVHKKSFDDCWNSQSFAGMLSSDVFFGFKSVDDRNICGFILCKRVFDEIEIVTFCVSQEYRSKGEGAMLLEALHSYARKKCAAKIFLDVSENNDIAIWLYKKFGYHEIARREKYYLDGSTAIVMLKSSFE